MAQSSTMAARQFDGRIHAGKGQENQQPNFKPHGPRTPPTRKQAQDAAARPSSPDKGILVLTEDPLPSSNNLSSRRVLSH